MGQALWDVTFVDWIEWSIGQLTCLIRLAFTGHETRCYVGGRFVKLVVVRCGHPGRPFDFAQGRLRVCRYAWGGFMTFR